MIFGTHNSCTYGSLQGCCTNMILPWTRNQTLTLDEQLDQGVQWLDFRLSYSVKDGQIYMSHTVFTEITFASILHFLVNRCKDASSACPLLYIHVRIDYADRPQAGVMAPILFEMFRSVTPYLCTKDLCGPTLSDTSFLHSHKLLFYCADGTIQNPSVISMDLAPTVFFWDAGTEENMEQRLNTLETDFQKQMDGPFLFQRDRMIIFDYSSQAPLWWTDRQQLALIKKYKYAILDANPSILSGNMIQDLMPLFS